MKTQKRDYKEAKYFKVKIYTKVNIINTIKVTSKKKNYQRGFQFKYRKTYFRKILAHTWLQ